MKIEETEGGWKEHGWIYGGVVVMEVRRTNYVHDHSYKLNTKYKD